MSIKAIRTEADYEAALARIDTLMDAEPGTPEGEELDVLTDLVEHYEEKHVAMGHQAPLQARPSSGFPPPSQAPAG
jgi:HTH-type transcriptional regulator/antitoxin HigA